MDLIKVACRNKRKVHFDYIKGYKLIMLTIETYKHTNYITKAIYRDNFIALNLLTSLNPFIIHKKYQCYVHDVKCFINTLSILY